MGHSHVEDPRCPECGEPIGATATYCMHCAADLTEERARADADGDGYWDTPVPTAESNTERAFAVDFAGILDPDGLVDNTLTAVVGLVGGLVVGVIGTIVLAILTSSGWALLFGVAAWLAATVHLATRRTVQEAVSRTAYGVALVLLLVPLIAFGPSSGGTDLTERVVVFATMLGVVAIPAAIAAGVGVAVSKFVPDARDEE